VKLITRLFCCCACAKRNCKLKQKQELLELCQDKLNTRLDVTKILAKVQQSYQVLKNYMEADFKFERDFVTMTRTFVVAEDDKVS
jgi:hypothetical protein